ncbi:LysR family transcriptional regulator [Jatrophihabitans sp. YIM 134969]
MDLDLRKVRYFVAVAETLHFGRAAERLHIAQPALSRQVRALEKDLGAELFTRDSHRVALTAAGQQLLTEAGLLLASADAARLRVGVAARGGRRLMVGFRSGIAVAPAVNLFAARHPDVPVDVQRIEGDDQADLLLDGRIDVAYVRLPIAAPGLRVASLYREPRVAVLPRGHRLAGKEEIGEADLDGEALIWPADTPQPTSRPHPDAGYRVRGVDETLEHVAAGRGISFLPRSTRVFHAHPEVVHVAVRDLAPDEVAVAVAASNVSPVVDDFVAAARAAADLTEQCGNTDLWPAGAPDQPR